MTLRAQVLDLGVDEVSFGFEFGDVQVIWRNDDGVLIPAADPRDRGVGRVLEIPIP